MFLHMVYRRSSRAGNLAVAALLIGIDAITLLGADSGPTVSLTGRERRCVFIMELTKDCVVHAMLISLVVVRR
jgi:hypothetical protein